MVSWLTTLFVGFGLLARPNETLITSLAIFALSVSRAIFLILELFSPYTGPIKVSSAFFRAALLQLGKQGKHHSTTLPFAVCQHGTRAHLQ